MNTDRYREHVRTLCEYAVNGAVGRPESDPVYRMVTEDRDTGSKYSSCGDLPHWLFYRLGIRMGWVNRDEHNGWRVGLNIGDLVYTSGLGRPIGGMTHLHTGDVVAVWNRADTTDSHILVVDRHIPGERIHSWDYGQPGGRRRVRELRKVTGGWFLGNKKIQSILRLGDVLIQADKAHGLKPVDLLALETDTADTDPAPDMLGSRTLRSWIPYMRGLDVEFAQTAVKAMPDGIFGPKTEGMVRLFQTANHLGVDGIVGPLTWAAIKKVLDNER